MKMMNQAGIELAKPHLLNLVLEADRVTAATEKAAATVTHLEGVLKPK